MGDHMTTPHPDEIAAVLKTGFNPTSRQQDFIRRTGGHMTKQTTLTGVEPPTWPELHYLGEQDEGAVIAWGRINKRLFLERFIQEGVITTPEEAAKTYTVDDVRWVYGHCQGDPDNGQGSYCWQDEPEDGLRPMTILVLV